MPSGPRCSGVPSDYRPAFSRPSHRYRNPEAMSKRHYAGERKDGFTFNHIACPHCGSPMHAYVTGSIHNTAQGVWDADSVDISCTDRACDETVGPNDTQDVWQPVINRILEDINTHWHFGRVKPDA